MFLTKPSFPVSFTKEQLGELVKKTLGRKFWHHYETKSTMLQFLPYYFFAYDAFFEEKNADSGALVVKDTQAGSMALNAQSGEFDESLLELGESEEPIMLKESPAPEGIEVDIERANMSESEVKKIAPIRLAAKLGVSKQNVELSNFKLVFVPFWRVEVIINEETFELVVNATTGEIAPEDEIPYREKSIMELTGETAMELRRPSAWLEYSRAVYHSVVDSETMRSIGKAIMTNHYLQAAIIIILIIILFWPRTALK
ncbi:MAG: hypothetical protein Q7R70_03605 [Candidatus Diapherotrites archaeon]|nr:hypothetical protein [Candidatus Diapherotrites archaeon]